VNDNRGRAAPAGNAGLAWWAGGAAVYLFTLATWVPWNRGYLGEQLDRSWQMVLKWAFLQRQDFGLTLAFTYGPWGFTITGYDREPSVCRLRSGRSWRRVLPPGW